MTGKCATCGKFLSTKGGAACCKCRNKTKVNRDISQAVPMPGDSSVDTPPSQLVSSASTGASGVSVGERVSCPSPGVDVGHEMQLLRAEIRSMRDDLKLELREFRLEVADLRQSLASCRKKVDSMESRLALIENRQEDVQPTHDLEHTVQNLRLEINDREQDLLLSDVEISNLPECAGENILNTVELVARKIGVTLDKTDIVYAERVGPRTERTHGAGGAGAARGRSIVVRLARRGLRDELLKSARVRRGATTADLDGFEGPPRRFYLNERLTRTNKRLFFLTRQTAANLGWKYTWTKRGRILTREADGKRTHAIRSEADLERVFGKNIVNKSND